MALLEASGIGKNFGDTKVLKDISLTLEQGEALAIIGSSGSGKTTLLRCLNFLERPDTGCIRVNGETMWDAADPATQRESEIRKKRLHFGLVFQNFNLFPQYTALQNVMLAGELLAKERPDYRANKKAVHAQLEQQARELLAQMGLSERADHYPHQLSGGQQQRVAFARAIVIKPSCILFDEPLSALDALLREEMRHELKDLVSALGFTSVFVTHDQTEAMSMSDKIAVLHNGVVEQYATPEEIYHHPSTAFVAHFVGKSNWLDETHLFRPEAVATSQGGGGKTYSLPVEGVQYLGDTYEVRLRFKPDVTWTVHSGRKAAVGDTLSVTIQPDQIITVNKE